MSKLTHLDDNGQAHMVDVSGKPETIRMARAVGSVQLSDSSMAALLEGNVKKGDALAVARIAGIMAAKKTSELIPLCHPLPISKAKVELEPDKDRNLVLITATVKTTGPTGVEMEALTAVSIAALTLYDMLKSVDKFITISAIKLDEKQGGKSGAWKRLPK
ncbi:MAG: cyclic pyranopterin monophosphate synthase MoaC [Planktomarina sp.]|nr:cyclic pyranopterin monophosphate synthase MoaC [Planktomarina sp.]MDT2033553.1 cyclic pyranopterin monophosphate synthase MoaC [Planktomarina sp.]MDT2040057.1 cyclic pyranopterin monophosphate synthase MoaC [Planktomarina sp.]MDT2049625.1 cyclic pyranopterin monophosphate synthase MoaC [Planktomarina sp.]